MENLKTISEEQHLFNNIRTYKTQQDVLNIMRAFVEYEKTVNDLKERIDKVIEYINSLEYFGLNMNAREDKEKYFKAKNKLLEILKGKRE